MGAGLTVQPEAVKGRTVDLSFSSEEYARVRDDVGNATGSRNRNVITEVLDHSPECVKLDRLNAIGTLLFNHLEERPIGRVDRAWVENRRGLAQVTFDEDLFSEEIFQKVQAGSLRGVSMGYIVDVYTHLQRGQSDGRFQGPCYVGTSWWPFEISIVSVPADPSVGVNRSLEDGPETAPDMTETLRRVIRINENIAMIRSKKA